MPCFRGASMLLRFNFAVSSLIFIVSAMSWKSPGSIFRMSLSVRKPINLPFSTTGNLRTFFFLNFFMASVMSTPGLIVTTFRFMRAFAWMFFKSSLDFLTIAQMMSFSVRIPLSLLPSFIIRLPTLFLTIVLAHVWRFVSGVTWTKFRVMRSPTFIPVSIFN